MLDVLLGEEIHNAAVVVTRYFGGTLLGTGGLVRAYSKAVQEGLQGSTVVEKKVGALLQIRTDYNGIGKIQYLLGQRGLTITNSEYTDIVTVETLVPEAQIEELREAVTEATNGKAEFPLQKAVCFAFLDGEPLLFGT
jgi:putative IMPACT (imprinted ancient) family translation regulator